MPAVVNARRREVTCRAWAQSIDLLTASNPAFRRFYQLPGDPGRQGPRRQPGA
jgi:hypothetical protein